MATTDMNAQIHIKDGNGNVNNIFPATKIENVEGLQTALNAKANSSDVTSGLAGKVDKETGKGLSTNDYTTTEKNKLAGIEAQANKTVVDSALSSSSENPLQNKVINTAITSITDRINVHDLGYVTPQMYGAAADGTTDDYNAFVSALASGLPVYIPCGQYYISEQIVFSGNSSAYMCGAGSGIDVHLFAKKGIKIAKDNITLKNFWLHGNDQATPKENNGITFSGTSNGLIVSDVLMSHYDCCISNEENNVRGYTFGNKFERIRVYASLNFIVFKDYGVGYNCYNNSFKDCWMLTTNNLGSFDHCRINFENCILFVGSTKFCLIGSSAELEYNSCTFETARLAPDESDYIFYNEGVRAVFRNCNFVENVNLNVYWFINVRNGRITLSECTFNAYSPEAKSGGILSIQYSSTCQTGSIEVDKLVAYTEAITVLTGRGLLERSKFNILDGIGITITGEETDLKNGVVYSKVNNNAGFLGKFLYNGNTLVPLNSDNTNE